MKTLYDLMTPLERARFDRLHQMADAIIEEQNQSHGDTPEEIAVDKALSSTLYAIHADRQRLLALAKGLYTESQDITLLPEATTRALTARSLKQVERLMAVAIENVLNAQDDTDGRLNGIVSYTLEKLLSGGKLDHISTEDLANTLLYVAQEAFYWAARTYGEVRYAEEQAARLNAEKGGQ